MHPCILPCIATSPVSVQASKPQTKAQTRVFLQKTFMALHMCVKMQSEMDHGLQCC